MKRQTSPNNRVSKQAFRPEEIEQMKSQNENLKSELLELARSMDEHVKKDKEAQLDNNYPEDFDEKSKDIKKIQF